MREDEELKLWRTKESTGDRETEGNGRRQKRGRTNTYENVITKPNNLYFKSNKE